ncbi:phosphorylase [Candidatus Bathycorpusculum sp.]|uniref:phosphorylase family protein n=1 Tax=Candidatus Bathycorpusculum sp. TaxID=2994959 RepID=UPI0028252CE9|nr:phosphorylase [Candidatus Termitimicrobium sp.]
MKKYGSTKRDICVHGVGIEPELVQENIIIAPWWEPSILPSLGRAVYLSAPDFTSTKVWNIENGDIKMTYIKTGAGAPVIMDALLSLGVTKCKKIVFIGSVGSLDENINIGDIVIPQYSICGDGASRYISSENLLQDVFGKVAYPDGLLFEKARSITKKICEENKVNWHIGRTFSIDTVFAQFAHIDYILRQGCNVIEMETAAAFAAGKLMKLPIVALFSVSDNSVLKKSLVSGRTEKEMNYRKFTRQELFPKIILAVFQK